MEVVGRAEFIALEAQVTACIPSKAAMAMEEHGWRCARSRSSRRLEIHHRYRSHGGTHRTENLKPVCGFCHKLIHRTEK
jgi:hypothetical protein